MARNTPAPAPASAPSPSTSDSASDSPVADKSASDAAALAHQEAVDQLAKDRAAFEQEIASTRADLEAKIRQASEVIDAEDTRITAARRDLEADRIAHRAAVDEFEGKQAALKVEAIQAEQVAGGAQTKTYADGSQRVGAPPFPEQSPLEEAAESLARVGDVA